VTKIDGRLRSRCRYCGAGIVLGGVCSSCSPAAAHDPSTIASGPALTEEELGLVLAWPEAEATDDDGRDAEVAGSPDRCDDGGPNVPL
jgi:hypothetical protein